MNDISLLNTNCPCGTGKIYSECCGAFILGQKKPSTPEALMRSRYSAYTQANIDYISRTMISPAKDHFNAQRAREWAERVEWIKLEVISTSIQSSKGFVEFIAYLKEEGKINTLHEISEFHKKKGLWFYVKGEHITT